MPFKFLLLAFTLLKWGKNPVPDQKAMSEEIRKNPALSLLQMRGRKTIARAKKKYRSAKLQESLSPGLRYNPGKVINSVEKLKNEFDRFFIPNTPLL